MAEQKQHRTKDQRHAESTPPAGPHDKPSLIDKEKTPGAGTLPDKPSDAVEPGTG
ncbi:hypothetical protein J5J10_15445 [Ciceribacter sp. L1K23]|uniref:hypothetical protein n=1 Tax=Ciceribacter sp. L1K23 TaxID=2820276 RepID=UPI001B81214C|nr:hypothetical protein [Ciceribacter sp. L1K23]MBR0557082.1 hypothetical protein [Ciceribacter sp. L1K23]